MIDKHNGLISTDDNDMYTLESITEMPDIISTKEEIAKLSLVDEKRGKQIISNLRKKVAFQTDVSKLYEVQKCLNNISKSSDKISDDEMWDRIEIKNAQDLKFLAEFREKEMKTLQNLMRTDTTDGQGTAAFAKVGLSIQDKQGNVTSVVLSNEEPD